MAESLGPKTAMLWIARNIHYAAPVIVVVAVLQWLLLLAIRPRRSQLKHLPTPNQGFFLFRIFHEPDVWEMEHWVDTVPHQGLIRYLGQYNEERILVASPAAAKDFLATEAYKFIKPSAQRRMIENVGGGPYGLLILEGQRHKDTRKALSPAFRHDEIRRAYPIMWNTAFNLVEAVRARCQRDQSDGSKSASGDLLKLINAATIDTFGHWGFSASIDAVKDPRGPIPRTFISSLKTTEHGQQFLFWAFTLGPHFVMRLPIRAAKILKGLVRHAVGIAEAIVTQHEKASEDGKPVEHDMLSIMMKSEYFSHGDLVHQAAHFVAAATETTAGTMGWAIHLLSRHPDIQARLREEVRAHLPSVFEESSPSNDSSPQPISENSFQNMKFLDAVVKEILRYHSINTTLWREAITPAKIAGECIPVGTKVLYSPWMSNRDPAVWGPDARTFYPYRWLDDDAKNKERPAYAFLTFGGGPRRCPGDEYAKAQMRCLIARLVDRFEFLPPEGDDGVRAGTDDGLEIGDRNAFTLFKIVDGNLRVRIREVGRD